MSDPINVVLRAFSDGQMLFNLVDVPAAFAPGSSHLNSDWGLLPTKDLPDTVQCTQEIDCSDLLCIERFYERFHAIHASEREIMLAYSASTSEFVRDYLSQFTTADLAAWHLKIGPLLNRLHKDYFRSLPLNLHKLIEIYITNVMKHSICHSIIKKTADLDYNSWSHPTYYHTNWNTVSPPKGLFISALEQWLTREPLHSITRHALLRYKKSLICLGNGEGLLSPYSLMGSIDV